MKPWIDPQLKELPLPGQPVEHREPITLPETKSRLALLEKTFEEFARTLDVTRSAVYRALNGDPFMQKLRDRIALKLDELERTLPAA